MYQQMICLDSLIDKLLVKIKSSDKKVLKINTIINYVFHQRTNEEYIRERIGKITSYQQQLQKLLQSPGIQQRTPEWYEARKTLITASDFAQALGEGKFGTQKELIKKKCGYEEEKFNANLLPLKWGTMFEPVATNIDSTRNNVKVYEFGLLRHPTINHFGASPDGISELGVMLEIKCPFKRKIDGTVPIQYYFQIQGQLDVCGLNECDYLECMFNKVNDFDELSKVDNGVERGAIIEFVTNGVPSYMYSDIVYDGLEGITELSKWVEENSSGQDCTIHLWFLDRYNTIRVYKDDVFTREKLRLVAEVWETILKYRNDKDMYDKYISNSTEHSKASKGVNLKGYSFLD